MVNLDFSLEVLPFMTSSPIAYESTNELEPDGSISLPRCFSRESMNTARDTNPLLSESAALQVRRADCHIRFSSALALVVVLSAASNALVLDEAPNPV
jgi:hypothetical protein